MANYASNLVGTLSVVQLSGTLANGQLANNSITVNAGTGLSGGGAVALGSLTMLNNTGVTALAGGGGVTVSAASGSVTQAIEGAGSSPRMMNDLFLNRAAPLYNRARKLLHVTSCV